MEKDCDCLKIVEDNVVKEIAKRESRRNFKYDEACWEHSSIYPKVRLYVNFMTRGTFEKKDGTRSRPQNNFTSIFFTYCPFCGKKYPEQKPIRS